MRFLVKKAPVAALKDAWPLQIYRDLPELWGSKIEDLPAFSFQPELGLGFSDWIPGMEAWLGRQFLLPTNHS